MANILVVDDDKNILRLLEFSLKRAGHTVTICDDGVQGLAQVKAQAPDLIVADVMMPKMTGYDFCKQIRTNLGLTELPIIMFSARFQPIDKQTALDAGATDYLSKNTSPDVLIARINELLPARPVGPTTQATLGLFSLRGGTGVTTLAVNLALVLALTKRAPTTLVDLAPLGGHAALMLGLRPTSSVADALFASKDDVALETVKPHFIQHASGIQLLASALNYDHLLYLGDKRLEQLVTTLKLSFSYTILDIPPLLEPRSGALLQLFDKIGLVLAPDMPSLQSVAVALQGLVRLGVADTKIVVIVNNILPQGGLPLEVIQKTLKRPILVSIPYEAEMVKAVNSGKPLLLSSPQSPAAAALAKLANSLLG
jgi:pilus assembly protein CpaE